MRAHNIAQLTCATADKIDHALSEKAEQGVPKHHAVLITGIVSRGTASRGLSLGVSALQAGWHQRGYPGWGGGILLEHFLSQGNDR